MRPFIVLSASLPLIGLVLGCSQPDPATSPPRDSSGVTIIEIPPRSSASAEFVLDSVPILDIGGVRDDRPDEELSGSGFIRAAMLSDGSVAVIDETKIKIYGPDGRLKHAVGQKGNGPGEYQLLWSICATRGDTILVDDRANNRLAVLGPTGTFVRHFTLSRGDLPSHACFGDGTFLAREASETLAADQSRPIKLNRMRLDTAVVSPLGTFPGDGRDPSFQRQVSIAASGDRFYVADPKSNQIQIYRVTGDAAAWAASLRPRETAVKITARDREKRGDEGPMSTTMMTEAMPVGGGSSVTIPQEETWPAFGQVMVDPSGGIWVEDYRKRRSEPIGWTKIDSTGKIEGRLVLPAPPDPNDSASHDAPRRELLGFVKDGVMFLRWDEVGALHVSIYPLRRR